VDLMSDINLSQEDDQIVWAYSIPFNLCMPWLILEGLFLFLLVQFGSYSFHQEFNSSYGFCPKINF